MLMVKKYIREAFLDINGLLAKENEENGTQWPMVDVDRVVLYTARHSLANHLLKTPGISVHQLAQIMGRSVNSISTYIHFLAREGEIVDISKNMPI